MAANCRASRRFAAPVDPTQTGAVEDLVRAFRPPVILSDAKNPRLESAA
jgi:hypothetical protein